MWFFKMNIVISFSSLSSGMQPHQGQMMGQQLSHQQFAQPSCVVGSNVVPTAAHMSNSATSQQQQMSAASMFATRPMNQRQLTAGGPMVYGHIGMHCEVWIHLQ